MSLFVAILGRIDGRVRSLYCGPDDGPQIRLAGDYVSLAEFLEDMPDRAELAFEFRQALERQVEMDESVGCRQPRGMKGKRPCDDAIHLRLHRVVDAAIAICRHYAGQEKEKGSHEEEQGAGSAGDAGGAVG